MIITTMKQSTALKLNMKNNFMKEEMIMKTFAKEFISMCGIEEINEYAKANNL